MDDGDALLSVGAPLPDDAADVGDLPPRPDVDGAPLEAKVRKDIWVLGAAVGIFGMS